jgi:serine/threonine-protein kinase HipA
VATWALPARGPAELAYDATWRASPGARPLSLSLPLTFDGTPLRGPAVEAYFDNLLPDGEALRRRVQARFRTASTSAFDLLAAVGRDCIGAVQLLGEDEEPVGVRRIDVSLLDDEAIARRLRAVTLPPGPGAIDDDDAFRISVAGAQEKTAFTLHRGRFGQPHGATPTTHLFKLPLGVVGAKQMDLSTSLENEWLCAAILRGLGVPMAECELRSFGDQRVLVVTRFDRKLDASGKFWLRLPQEDFCQATGTPSAFKYEADGGPGLVEMARLLGGAEAPDVDRALLLRAQLGFFLLGAPDGHAKNFSLHLFAQNRFRLTPLYDVISAWPISGPRANQIHPKKLRLAMAMHGKTKHWRVDEVRRRHFESTARACGVEARRANDLVDDVLARVPSVLDAVGNELPRRFPEKVFDAIARGIRASAARL